MYDSQVTANSTRRGATGQMMRKVKLQSVVAKTGHDMTKERGESTVWEYYDFDQVLLDEGSAGLANWPRPEQPIKPPTLKTVLNADNKEN